MKKHIRHWIAVVLLTFGVSLPSHASVTCLAPEPTCAVVLVGALVTRIVSGTDDQAAGALQAGSEQATLEAVVDEIEHTADERLAIRIRDADRDTPGFNTIVTRFDNGRHEGPRSLDSLMKRDPQLFDDLERIAAVIERHFTDEVMAETYGPMRLDGGEVNWERYASLARDALAIRDNMRANGR